MLKQSYRKNIENLCHILCILMYISSVFVQTLSICLKIIATVDIFFIYKYIENWRCFAKNKL